MTEASSIFVRLEGKDVGLSTLLTQVDQKTQKSADSAARLQAQMARLAATQGNTSQATNILSNALLNNGGASQRVVTSMATQLAVLQRGGGAMTQLTTATQGLSGTLAQLGGQLSGLGGTAGSLAGSLGNLAGSMGTLGGIGAVIGLGKVAFDLGVAGANADLLRERFDSLAVSAGTTGDALIKALRAASGGEISDLNLTLAANKAQLLGVADSAEEFGALMGIARDRAQQMGISTTQAFNDLTTGLGRGSALILDNLGIIVSVKEANEQYAASLGKTAAALTEAEQKQALINQVLAQGKASLDTAGGAIDSTSGKIAAAGANIANITSGIGTAISEVFLGPLAENFNKTAEATQSLTTWIGQLGTVSASATAQASANAAATAAYTAEIERSGSVTQATAAYEAAHALSLQQSAQAAGASVGPMAAAAAGQTALGAAAAAATTAQQQLTTDLQANAEAAILAAAQQNAQSQATANLKAATDETVTAFLNLNPNIDAAGIAAQVAAGKIPALIGQLAGLRVAAYSARDAVAALAAQQAINTKVLATPGIGAPGRSSGRNNDIDAVLALQKANKDAADARSAQIVAIGSDQAKVNELERQYGAAVKASGVGSAAAINAETRLKQARIEAARTTGGGGGGAAAARLTDQQKLNNQLLATQEAADAKFEDAAKDHQQRLLDIQIDFAKKSLQQQKQNEVSKRASLESFYDQLTSSELNKSEEGTNALRAIDAQYQADYQKSQELAQQGKAKQSADLLALAQKQAQDEITYQENIAKAKEEKDKAEVSRLEAIHKLHQDTANEERRQVLEGGDANVDARDQAIADEAARFDEAQGKIGTSAERAAERQEAAALRSGKAIDANQVKLDRLKTTYDQLSPAAGGSAPVTTTGGVVAATTTPAPGDSAVVAALDGLREAIAAVERATTNAGKGVEGAVRGLSGKLAT